MDLEHDDTDFIFSDENKKFVCKLNKNFLQTYEQGKALSNYWLTFYALCELIAIFKPTHVESIFSYDMVIKQLCTAHLEVFIEDNVLLEDYLESLCWVQLKTGMLKFAPNKKDALALLVSGGKDSLAAMATLRFNKPKCYHFYNEELGVSPWLIKLLEATNVFGKVTLIPAPSYTCDVGGLTADRPSWDYLTMAMTIVGASHHCVALGADIYVNESDRVHGAYINYHQYDKTVAYCDEILTRVRAQFNSPLEHNSPSRNMHIASTTIAPSHWQYVVSCNHFTDTERWCNTCAKCAYTQLLAFVNLEQAAFTYFTGSRFLNESLVREKLLPFVQGGSKPLDCIGSTTEIFSLMKRAKIELS